MKIAVYSDLHLEFEDWTPPKDLRADVVVLAGDIYPGTEGVEWAKKSFDKPVVYVAGNHDYWNGKDYRYTLEQLRKAAEGSHVHFLHNDAVVIDGWRFVGSTLWTDFKLNGQQPLSMLDAQQMMNDFENIRGPRGRRLQATDLLEEFTQAKAFIDAQLRASPQPVVVVTHHAPSQQSIHPRYGVNNKLSPSYASSLESLMGEPVRLWIHGHTHDSFDYCIEGTRVVANPRGYAPRDMNAKFQEDFVAEL